VGAARCRAKRRTRNGFCQKDVGGGPAATVTHGHSPGARARIPSGIKLVTRTHDLKSATPCADSSRPALDRRSEQTSAHSNGRHRKQHPAARGGRLQTPQPFPVYIFTYIHSHTNARAHTHTTHTGDKEEEEEVTRLQADFLNSCDAHTHTHTHKHTHTHTNTHTHTHTHTHYDASRATVSIETQASLIRLCIISNLLRFY